MTYSYFHLLKKYQEIVSCDLEQVTLKELEVFASKLGKEEPGYDIFRSHHSSHGSHGNW